MGKVKKHAEPSESGEQDHLIRRFRDLVIEEVNRRKISNTELAKLVGVSRTTVIYHLNHSKNLTTKTMARYADALGFELKLE